MRTVVNNFITVAWLHFVCLFVCVYHLHLHLFVCLLLCVYVELSCGWAVYRAASPELDGAMSGYKVILRYISPHSTPTIFMKYKFVYKGRLRREGKEPYFFVLVKLWRIIKKLNTIWSTRNLGCYATQISSSCGGLVAFGHWLVVFGHLSGALFR